MQDMQRSRRRDDRASGSPSVREIAHALLAKWKVIAVFVAVVVATVAVLDLLYVKPQYESAVVIALNHDGQISSLNFDQFRVIVSSPEVMSAVLVAGGWEMTPGEVRDRYRFAADKQSGIVTAFARALDPRQTVQLLEHWVDAVNEEVRKLELERIAERKRFLEANYQNLLREFTAAEEALVSFDRALSISALESEFNQDLALLMASTKDLETLKYTAIPADEAAIEVLKASLAEEEAAIDTVAFRNLPLVGETEFVVNPAYFDTRIQLIRYEANLAANQEKVRNLEQHIRELEIRVEAKNTAIANAKLERARLARARDEASVLYENARREYLAILNIENQMQNQASVRVISRPELPDEPIAAGRLLRDLVLAVLVGSAVGVFGVFLPLWWRMPTERAHSEVGTVGAGVRAAASQAADR